MLSLCHEFCYWSNTTLPEKYPIRTLLISRVKIWKLIWDVWCWFHVCKRCMISINFLSKEISECFSITHPLIFSNSLNLPLIYWERERYFAWNWFSCISVELCGEPYNLLLDEPQARKSVFHNIILDKYCCYWNLLYDIFLNSKSSYVITNMFIHPKSGLVFNIIPVQFLSIKLEIKV